MPYSKEHKLKSRDKILTSAVKLFCSKGFDNVSIDDLMNDAELTRGGFYSHFKSKSDVYNEAIIAATQKSDIVCGMPQNASKSEVLEYFVNNYLSLAHVKQQISPCPMAFLVTDVANNDPKVKQTYTKVYEGFAAMLKNNLPTGESKKQQNEKSLALSALVIGTVAIGRALDDEALQIKLLESTKEMAWQVING